MWNRPWLYVATLTGSNKRLSSASAISDYCAYWGVDIHIYYLNEGHAALLTLDLLDRYRPPPRRKSSQESRPTSFGSPRTLRVYDAHAD